MNQKNQNSNKKKYILGFRNMQEKLENIKQDLVEKFRIKKIRENMS